MLSRRVIAYYGLIRDSESLPAAYEFAAESAAPREIGLRWESRGSPIYSAGLCSRAASHTPVAPKSAVDCCFLPGFSLHLRFTGSATTLVDFEAAEFDSDLKFVLILRPASWLALLSRTFTFEFSLTGSPQANVEIWTTWVNSQFPRPDFHRQVQRHYGLQEIGLTPRLGPQGSQGSPTPRLAQGSPQGSPTPRLAKSV